LRADSVQTTILSEEFCTEDLTTEDIFSIKKLNEVVAKSCSLEKEATPNEPFCNFLVRAFKIEDNLGKKNFKKIK